MSYSTTIPNINDFLAISQKQMVANFQAINNTFFVDHIGLTAVEDVGDHKGLTFRAQSGNPTTASDQCALYNKIVSSIPQLFFRSSSNQTPIQLTNGNLNTLQTGSLSETQSSFLAGPFTIYMGYIRSCPDMQLVTLTPSSNLIYVGLSTILESTGSVIMVPGPATTTTATNITGNQFTVRYNTAQILVSPTIYYSAVGL